MAANHVVDDRVRGVTKIDIRARIDPEDGRFRMWESNPDTANFVTNGQHVGETSDGFRRLRATWKGDDGSLGTLELRAVDERDESFDF